MKALEFAPVSLDALDEVSGGLSLATLGRVGAPVVYAQAAQSYAPSYSPGYAVQPQYVQNAYDYYDPYGAGVAPQSYASYYEPDVYYVQQQTQPTANLGNVFGNLVGGLIGNALGVNRAPASNQYEVVEYYY